MRFLGLLGTNLKTERLKATLNLELGIRYAVVTLKYGRSFGSEKGFLLVETILAKDIWDGDDNQLWDDIRGLMDGGMVRKRDVRK